MQQKLSSSDASKKISIEIEVLARVVPFHYNNKSLEKSLRNTDEYSVVNYYGTSLQKKLRFLPH